MSLMTLLGHPTIRVDCREGRVTNVATTLTSFVKARFSLSLSRYIEFVPYPASFMPKSKSVEAGMGWPLNVRFLGWCSRGLIGGGVIIVRTLGFFFELKQHQTQGTTLALLVPPIGPLATWTYYAQGYVDLKIAAFVCLGFFLGGLRGAKIAIFLPNLDLERIFLAVLLVIAPKTSFTK